MKSEGSNMRSACYVGERRLELFDLEPRDPGEGEVTIDVAYTGICGTDLHMYDGRVGAKPGLVLGHEPHGVVESVGKAVSMGLAHWCAKSTDRRGRDREQFAASRPRRST